MPAADSRSPAKAAAKAGADLRYRSTRKQSQVWHSLALPMSKSPISSSADTIQRRFTGILRKKRSSMKMRLRRAQLRLALGGNVAVTASASRGRDLCLDASVPGRKYWHCPPSPRLQRSRSPTSGTLWSADPRHPRSSLPHSFRAVAIVAAQPHRGPSTSSPSRCSRAT